MILSTAFSNSSIRFRISLLIVLSSSLALVLAGIAVLGYEGFLQRGAASRQLSAQAEIIAESSTATLSFSDQRAATLTLLALRGDSQVLQGVIYDRNGHLFARYERNASASISPPHPLRAPGVYFERGDVLFFGPIKLGEERIGTIFLESTSGVSARLRSYVGIICLILVLSQGLALPFSARMQRTITKPVSELSIVAKRISVDKDYTVRAVRYTGGELGILIDSFNHMLSQIQLREWALRESEERYALAARGANDGLWDWKFTTDEVYFSSRWNQMLGYDAVDQWSHPEEWFTRIHPSDRSRVKAEIAAHREGVTSELTSEYRMRHENGSYIWVLSRGIVFRNPDGVAVRMAGSQTDITEGKVADPLTTLPNRIYFIDKLECSIDTAQHEGKAFAVMFLDVDRFKTINDSLGHAAGDELLMRIAMRLRSSLRVGWEGRPSVVARLGGDEFAILLNDIRDQADAEAIGKRILEKLETPFQLEDRPVFATLSIGIALGSSSSTPEELLRNADTAMYYAKARGKARFAVFDEGMRERAVARMEVETGLRKAIPAGELTLYYQPKVSVKDRRIVGYEALVRWNHPELGTLQPGEFIPIAEESDLIIHLGKWVLREACRQMAEWQKRFIFHPPLTVSINVSPRHLRDAGLIAEVEKVLAETGLIPSCLSLEVTESSIMENPESALTTLSGLRLLGIGLEIDDFGTGHSSLSLLQRLPFDTLKIDQSFVRELGAGREGLEIIKTILNLARSLQLEVVAEGVETKDQLEHLEALCCETVQGFFFSKPVTAERTQALMKERADLQCAFEVLEGTGPDSPEASSHQLADRVKSPDGALVSI